MVMAIRTRLFGINSLAFYPAQGIGAGWHNMYELPKDHLGGVVFLPGFAIGVDELGMLAWLEDVSDSENCGPDVVLHVPLLQVLGICMQNRCWVLPSCTTPPLYILLPPRCLGMFFSGR